jgi:general secretion pathway protein F
MPAFEYQALDKVGNTRKGVLEGDTPRQVRQKLRNQNFYLSFIDYINYRTN